MRQRPFVLKDVAKITAIHPAAAGGAANEILGLFLGGSPTRLPKMVPRGIICAQALRQLSRQAGDEVTRRPYWASWPVSPSAGTITLVK